jgi:dinuclear metal center YbgI/SA1388 family protein
MLIKEITEHLEKLFPVSLQESYDNSGLLIGSPDKEVKKALITLDVTNETLDEAIENQCDLIIAHHPVIFKGLKKLTGSNSTEEIVIKAIKSDTAIYAVHTNMDNSVGGVNSILCHKLGLTNTKILSPRKEGLNKIACFCPVSHLETVQLAMFSAGAGNIGNYDNCSYYSRGTGTFKALDGSNPFVGQQSKLHKEDEFKIETIVQDYNLPKVINAIKTSHPYEEPAYDIYRIQNTNETTGSGMIGELENEKSIIDYLKFVKSSLGIEYIRHNKLIDRNIKKVAVCGGSGSFLINDAAKQGADIFISADIKYHDFFEYVGNMTIVDAGHFETEHPVKELLYSILMENFPNFALQISKMNASPIFFL